MDRSKSSLIFITLGLLVAIASIVWFNSLNFQNSIYVHNQTSAQLADVTISIGNERTSPSEIDATKTRGFELTNNTEGSVRFSGQLGNSSIECDVGYATHHQATVSSFIVQEDGSVLAGFSYGPSISYDDPIRKHWGTCFSTLGHLNTSRKNEIYTEVNSAFQGLVDASKSLDHEKYFSYFDAEKYTTLNEDGTVLHSLDAFREMYLPQQKYIKSYQSLEFSNVKIDVIDASTAVLVNEYTASVTLTSGETVSAAGAGTQVWSKRTGTWKLVNVSSSLKP